MWCCGRVRAQVAGLKLYNISIKEPEGNRRGGAIFETTKPIGQCCGVVVFLENIPSFHLVVQLNHEEQNFIKTTGQEEEEEMNGKKEHGATEGEEGLEVVIAGFSRTGTGSLTAALEILLGRPCYHTNNLVHNSAMQQRWIDMIDSGFKDDQLIIESFKGYGAGADLPFCLFYQEFLRLFPTSKVILSIRDTPEQVCPPTSIYLITTHTNILFQYI